MKRLILFLAIGSTFAFTFKTKKFSKLDEYAFIHSGTTTLNNETYSCNAFYMATTEVSNAHYREFLADLVKEGRMADYEIAVPDTAQWTESLKNMCMEPMKNLYFSHPAYDNYPVVNVSKKGADMYCIWLTKKMRAMFPNELLNDFRLPTKKEWVYAARGGLKMGAYPWGGPNTKNVRGCSLANYLEIGDKNITKDKDGQLKIVESPILTGEYMTLAGVSTYNPNGFGLYNMSGNCAELVAKEDVVMGGSWLSPGHDIKVTSEQEFTKANPTVGFRPVVSFLISD